MLPLVQVCWIGAVTEFGKVRRIPGDIPARVIKEFSLFLCVPMADVINCGLRVGHWPKTYKRETITPTPKQYIPQKTEKS